jgi:hypothetical protein
MTPARRLLLGSSVVVLSACTLLTQASDLRVGMDEEPKGDAGRDDVGSPTPIDAASEPDVVVDAAKTRATLYRETVLADAPISYWRFDETSGLVAHDETGRFDGRYDDGPTLGVAGLFGANGAIEVGTGTTAHVSVAGDPLKLAGTNPFSIEVWILPRLFEDYEWIAGTERGPSQARLGWSLLVNAQAAPSFEVWQPNDAGGATQVRGFSLGAQGVVLDAWQHLVVTYDGTTHVGYLNGVVQESMPYSAPIPMGDALVWGCRRGDMDLIHCLDGWRLDEAAIYGTALPATRVAAHYDLGKL